LGRCQTRSASDDPRSEGQAEGLAGVLCYGGVMIGQDRPQNDILRSGGDAAEIGHGDAVRKAGSETRPGLIELIQRGTVGAHDLRRQTKELGE
jgi:hypothetical protein